MNYFLHFSLQLLEAQTMCSIFQGNETLCNEVNEKVVQHFVHAIESHGKHVQYLRFLQTIVKTENQFIRLVKLATTCRSAVAQLVEPPSRVLVWCNSTDEGSKHTTT